jgi:hypothetical protein
MEKVSTATAKPGALQSRFFANNAFVRVYDSPVFFESHSVNGIIVARTVRQPGDRQKCFSGPCRKWIGS